jgi:hypothetical protein
VRTKPRVIEVACDDGDHWRHQYQIGNAAGPMSGSRQAGDDRHRSVYPQGGLTGTSTVERPSDRGSGAARFAARRSVGRVAEKELV